MQRLLESLAPVFKITHLRRIVRLMRCALTMEVNFDNAVGVFKIIPRILV